MSFIALKVEVGRASPSFAELRLSHPQLATKIKLPSLAKGAPTPANPLLLARGSDLVKWSFIDNHLLDFFVRLGASGIRLIVDTNLRRVNHKVGRLLNVFCYRTYCDCPFEEVCGTTHAIKNNPCFTPIPVLGREDRKYEPHGGH